MEGARTAEWKWKSQDTGSGSTQVRARAVDRDGSWDAHLQSGRTSSLYLDARLAEPASATAGIAKASADTPFEQSVDGLSSGVSGSEVVGRDGRGNGAEQR